MLTLKNLTCSNVAKQLEGFRLEHFFSSVHCSVRFVCVCVCTALLSPSRMHMLLCSDILFDAHEVPHLKYAFLPLAKRKSGWEVWKMCFDKCHLCVATMKYASPPAFPPPPPPPFPRDVIAIEPNAKAGGLTGRMSYIDGCVINAFIECRHTHTYTQTYKGRGDKDGETW